MRLLLLLFISLSLVACEDGPDADEQQGSGISVSATGSVEAEPDMMTLTATVRLTGEDVSALQLQVDDITQAVVKAAENAGVEPDDIDSSRLSVQPEYDWQERKRVYMGQSVQRSIVMVLRELESYGALVQALSGLELFQLSPPQLGHSNIEELRLQAIDDALQRATAKAGRVARGIDEELGDVISVDVHGVMESAPMAMAMEASSQRAPQIQFGKRRIAVNVSMRFAID